MAVIQTEKDNKIKMIYRIDNITYRYPGSERKVLDKASLQLEKGKILCVLGPNGAGKTTLLSCMAGLLKPESGTITLCENKLETMSEREIAKRVAFVPQLHTPAFDYRCVDFVLMGRAPKIGVFGKPSEEEEDMCRKVLSEMGIEHLADKSYMEISGGERQQLLIARAIVQEPEVVLFDEPTAHLDYGNQHRVLERIKQMSEEGYSIIITTHNPDHALLLGDQAAIVSRDGKIVQGDSKDILTEALLSEVYGIELKIQYLDAVGRIACLVPGL